MFPPYEDYSANRGLPVKGLPNEQLESRLVNPIFLIESKGELRPIWGMQDSAGLYRLHGNKWYKVADTSGLIIYYGVVRSNWLHLADVLTLSNDEEDYLSERPFFSLHFSAPVIEMNQENIKAAVNDTRFSEALQKALRRSLRSVDARDAEGRFIVNSVYSEIVRGEK